MYKEFTRIGVKILNIKTFIVVLKLVIGHA
jgi:hypothetical protein